MSSTGILAGTAATSIQTAATNKDLLCGLAVRIPITSTSKSIADILTALSTALPAATVSILIVREESSSGSIRWAISEAASATTAEWPPSGLELPTNKTDADVIELYAATTQYATLLAFIPRN